MSVWLSAMTRWRVLSAALVLFVPATGEAQSGRWSTEFSLGPAVAWRDVYNDRPAFSIDALASRAFADLPLRWGLGVSVFDGVANNDACTLTADLRCRGDLPTVGGATAYIGSELLRGDRTGKWSVRVMGGPGIYRASSATLGGGAGRIDVALPFGSRVTMIASARSASLPALAASGRGTHAVGLGIRVQ